MINKDIATFKAETREEHQRLRMKCFDFEPLKDGDRVMFVLPAFDFRGGPDDRFGQHTATLVFAKRKGNKAVSVEFFTGWTVSGKRVIMDGEDVGFMCTGLYTHYHFKKDAGEYAHASKDCPYIAGKCYGELGSSLYGDIILSRLVNEGSAGVWDEIEKELNQ